MSDVLAFSGVSVVRGGNTLLADISWEVEEGQRWVILGPNGAGKTTLLQLAAARIHPSDGVVGILGEVLGAVDVFELRPRIGLASASIAERIPGGERVVDVVVTASYAVVGRWREEYDALDLARAQGLLGSMGVGHLANRTFGTLSEGERKRVQIARALMTDPELMLLDEPAAGLDLGGREDLVARLSALAEDVDAPVLVLVTHHVEEIPPGFTDVLLLREGRVVAAGPLELTLTAANLSATFGLPLALDRHGARWSARAADPGRHTDADPGRGPGAARTLDVTADRNLGLGALAADLAASYAGTEAHR
jgi:iron complex transport system ATP-binding protein